MATPSTAERTHVRRRVHLYDVVPPDRTGSDARTTTAAD